MADAVTHPPLVYVVAPHPQRAQVLADALKPIEVHHIADSDTLLKQTHVAPPNVVLLYTDTVTTPSVAELLSILRRRAELASTRWLAVGTHGLGDMLTAGADALIGDATPIAALATQVRVLVSRAQQHKDDLDRIKQQQQRIEDWEHEEKVRDELVHMLVHDLKNPIAAVMGLIELVQDDEEVPEGQRELLQIARDETKHLLHLTVNLLDVRKIQAGKMNIRRELMFGPMFEEVIEHAQGDVGGSLKQRHVHVTVERDLSPVNADPEILRRVLTNLFSNASKHTNEGGHITVKIVAQPDGLKVSVKDDGEGIPSEDIPKLFAAFEQSRLTLHGRFDTGLGLAFCRMAIEAHGGKIWVESERGKGAHFMFTLPFSVEDDDDLDMDFAELLN